MRNYQLVMVLRPSLSEPQRKKVLESVKGWLKDVKVTKENEWGLKLLSYKIKKETEGFFLEYLLETKETIPLDFEKKIVLQDEILRHLLIKFKVKSSKLKVEDKKEKN